MDTKKCSKCKEEKGLCDFNTIPDRPSGYRSECKKCQYKTQSKRLRKRIIPPEVSRARANLHYAVKVGTIVKPKKCEVCRKQKPLDGHHRDYSNAYDVQWVCSKCHCQIHLKKKIA